MILVILEYKLNILIIIKDIIGGKRKPRGWLLEF
jgi:hypothetical protein